MSPTVKKGSERVRVCLHAGNTFEEVEGLLGCVRKWIGMMERRGEVQVRDELEIYGPGESSSAMGVHEGHGSVGVNLKGKTRIERAKL